MLVCSYMPNKKRQIRFFNYDAPALRHEQRRRSVPDNTPQAHLEIFLLNVNKTPWHEKIRFLKAQDDCKNTLGLGLAAPYSLALCNISELTHYIAVMRQLVTDKQSADAVLALNQLKKNLEGWAFGSYLIVGDRGVGERPLLLFLELLLKLQSYGCVIDRKLFPRIQDHLFISISRWITSSTIDISKAFYFLALNMDLQSDYYEILKAYKEKFLDLLLGVNKLEDKIILARQALNPDHALGKLFWTQRGIRKPALTRGTLKKISDLCADLAIKNSQLNISTPSPKLDSYTIIENYDPTTSNLSPTLHGS